MGAITAAVVAAVMGAVMGAVINALLGNSIPAVLKKRKYGRNLKKNVNKLRRKVEGLNQLKTDVELRKRNIRRGRMVKNEVEHWLSCVKIINEEVQVVEKLFSAISGSCLAKACLGKTVLEKIGEVEKLCEEGKFPGDIGIDRPSTPGAVREALREGVAELNQLKDVIDRPSTSGAKPQFSAVKKSSKKRKKVDAVTKAPMDILMPAVSRKLEYCRNLEKNMNTLREGVAKLRFFSVKESFKKLKHALDRLNRFKKLKHALDRLNRRKKEVETLKSRPENAGKVVREEVNDWLIAVRSINAVIQILEDVSPWVSPCDIRKFNEIVQEKSQEVNTLHQQGTFPDGIVTDNRRKPKRG